MAARQTSSLRTDRGIRLDAASLAIFATLLVCYVYFFPRWGDWNANSRFDLVRAIVDDHSVSIDQYADNTGDYATVGGRKFSDKAPGVALMSVPVYALFRAVVPESIGNRLHLIGGTSSLVSTVRPGGSGLEPAKAYEFTALAILTFAIVSLPSAALGVLFYLVSRQLGSNSRVSLIATLAYGLATSAFPYATSLAGHQTSAFLLFAAFAVLIAVRVGQLARSWLFLAGFLLGYAAITEYQTVLIGVVLVGYACLSFKRPINTLVVLAVGSLPALLGLIAYDLVTFGTPLPVGYLHSTLWADVHSTGFVSLTYPHLEALWGITFGTFRGLFFLSPYLLLAVPGYVRLWNDRTIRAEFWVIALSVLAFFLFNSSSAMWSGGFAVGPRYLVPALPFLALAAGQGLAASWRSRSARLLVILLVTWSFFAIWVETIGGQAFPDYTLNPLFALSLPAIRAGDVARNFGMILGLRGLSSLTPLVSMVLLGIGWVVYKSPASPTSRRSPGSPSPVIWETR